jgi:hypothetical protein
MERAMERKYSFFWNLIGDLGVGRPNLGPEARIEVYRLMQYCFRDVLEARFGTPAADEVFREAGALAGRHFFKHLIRPVSGAAEFLDKLQRVFREFKIGILRVEEAQPDLGRFIITVSEDLDCSGVPETHYEMCTYDEGFMAALLECLTGRPYDVREIECWCTGGRTCRFIAEVRP